MSHFFTMNVTRTGLQRRMSSDQCSDATTRTEPPDDLDVNLTPSASSPRSASTFMYRRILLIVAIIVCLVLGVYFKHFHRLPTEDILAANLARQNAASEDYSDDDSTGDEVDDDMVKRSQRNWDQFIRHNHFVSIGKLFDKCGEISIFKCYILARFYAR